MKEELIWIGPFKIEEPITNDLRGRPGIYRIEYNSETLYVGKSKRAALRRAKDHFRGQGDSTGRWILEGRDKSKICLWVKIIDNIELIDKTEKDLIQELKPRGNVNNIGF